MPTASCTCPTSHGESADADQDAAGRRRTPRDAAGRRGTPPVSLGGESPPLQTRTLVFSGRRRARQAESPGRRQREAAVERSRQHRHQANRAAGTGQLPALPGPPFLHTRPPAAEERPKTSWTSAWYAEMDRQCAGDPAAALLSWAADGAAAAWQARAEPFAETCAFASPRLCLAHVYHWTGLVLLQVHRPAARQDCNFR